MADTDTKPDMSSAAEASGGIVDNPEEQFIDIDGGHVKKRVLVEGTGELPTKGHEVIVHYVGTLSDGTQFDSSRDRGQHFNFVLGRGDVIKGWDVGVATMKTGETAKFIISPDYGYGTSGSGAIIPPNSTLHFEVELFGCRPVRLEKHEMTPEERLCMASEEKDAGNKCYNSGKLSSAITHYKEAVDLLTFDDDGPESLEQERKKTLLSSFLNLASCYLKTEQFSEAIIKASEAIAIDDSNSKAWYRRGVARMSFGLLDESKMDLLNAAKLDSKNIEVRRELQKCKEKLSMQREAEKKTFGSIFKSSNLYSEKKSIRAIEKLPKVFLSIKLGGNEPKRLVIALYSDRVPRTAENFRCLCTGEKDPLTDDTKLSFKGNKFHRIIKNFMMQGGDITEGNGRGGMSIYGERFDDENFKDQHSFRGQLSMANCGPNTNSSQFFILFGPQPSLDGKHVVFGEVVEGVELLDDIEVVETNDKDTPLEDVEIVDCGIVSR